VGRVGVAKEVEVLSLEVKRLHLDKIVNGGIQVTAFGLCSKIHYQEMTFTLK
jgi:hypothetical protein